jgi:hypothetical protein
MQKRRIFEKKLTKQAKNKGILASNRVARFLKAIVRVTSKKSLRTPGLSDKKSEDAVRGYQKLLKIA